MAEGRHELKLPIHYGDWLQLRARLPLVASPDENAGEGGIYRVTSLYFDNYADKALREKIDGVDEREKFRLRLYNGDTGFIRLEKKSKKSGICFKESAPMSAEECRRLLEGDRAVLRERKEPLLEELYLKMAYQQLRPKNIVDYRREAYVFPAGNVRVTVDSDIRGSSAVGEFLTGGFVGIPVSQGIILEVKYDNYLPELIRGLVSLSSRQATAFSKYAMARI